MAFYVQRGAWVFGLVVAAGCGFDSTGVTAGTPGDPPCESSGETGAGTTTTATMTPTSEGSGGTGCAPGDEQACSCSEGEGTQVCGQGGVFGACECPEPTTGTVDPSTTGTVDPSTTTLETTSGETTSGDPSTTSGESTSDPSTTTTDPSTSTGMMECVQLDDEPNDDPQMNAQDHAGIACKDNAKQIVGTLADPGDIDWHVYLGDDGGGSGCKMMNIISKHTITADAPVRLCAYITCTAMNSLAEVACNSGKVDPNYPGCCLDPTDNGTLDLDFNCTNTGTETAFVSVSVGTAALECVNYAIDYTWDN